MSADLASAPFYRIWHKFCCLPYRVRNTGNAMFRYRECNAAARLLFGLWAIAYGVMLTGLIALPLLVAHPF